jgi:hypothetical protein
MEEYISLFLYGKDDGLKIRSARLARKYLDAGHQQRICSFSFLKDIG